MATKKDKQPTGEVSEEQAAASNTPVDFDSRLEEAQAIVRNNVKWAAGIGVVPFPIVDLVGIVGVQVRMLKRLSDLYKIPFMEHKVKNLVTSLIIGGGSVKLGAAVAMGFAKFIPFIGTTIGVLSLPVAAGALTHATGQVFIQHFETGGNLLDFEPTKVREHFREEYSNAESKLKDQVSKA